MLKQNKIAQILCGINIILFLCILFFLLFNASYRSLPSQETILLNPKYVPLMDYFIIENFNTQEIISFEKTHETWIGKTGEGIIFPVASSVESFINSMSSMRMVETVSTSYESWDPYSLTPQDALSVSFKNSATTEIYSRIYFGSENFNGQKIYFRTDKSNVYQTVNDLYQFLSTRISLWCDTKLIPNHIGITEDSIQKIIITNESTTSLDKNNPNFISYANRLLQTTGLPVLPSLIDNLSSILRITLENGNGREYEVSIYQNPENSLYYLQPPVTQEFNYVLEVSEWTYNKLIDTIKVIEN